MKINTSFKKGYSLIEVLVAVAILMFSIVGPMTIAAKSIQSAQFAKQQNTAFFLAQEGISMTENIRNYMALRAYRSTDPTVDSWSAWVNTLKFAPCKTATGCNFSLDDVGGVDYFVSCISASNACTLNYNGANLTGALQRYHTRSNGNPDSIYKRVITWQIDSAYPDEVIVTSTVEWYSNLFGEKQSVTQSSSLFNKYKDL